MIVMNGYVIKWEATVEITKLYAGDYGINFSQAKLNRIFLNRIIDPPEKRRDGLVFRQTDKHDEYANLIKKYF